MISLVLCFATIIFDFKRLEVFSKMIFSIFCSFSGNQSKWSRPIEVTTLARLFFNILVASNLKNNPLSIKLILSGYCDAFRKNAAVSISKKVIGSLLLASSISLSKLAKFSSFISSLLKTNLSLIFLIWGLV